MSAPKKQDPKKGTQNEKAELSQEELDEAAGGIIVQGGILASQMIPKAPTVSAPTLPGLNDLAL